MFAFAFFAACDMSGGAGLGCGGDGCIRVHQGDYTFPVKRIVQDALKVRVTQGGLDFLTERVKALVFTFFDADADGNAVIALADLGLGDVGTSLGPFSAAVENLVVSLDLDSLSVSLIPGSSPAQLRIEAQDVEVGIVSGQVTGAYDGILVDGDAECQLASGSSGQVARLSFALVMSLDTDPGGIVTIDVVSLDVDTKDIDLDISTDCNVPACDDGLPPQCSECTVLCGAASLGSSLVSFLQNVFDGLIDDLVSFIADDVANLVLDLLFNGQPLAVEGTVDYGPTMAPLLSYLATAEPLGVAGRPGGQAFVITGSGGAQGLDVTLDAGVDTAATHPCVGDLGTEPVFKAGPPPEFPETLSDGTSYEVAIALSEALINETIWSLYRGGALCIDATSPEITALTGGSVELRAGVMDLMLPGIADLAGPDAPLRIRMRPTLNADVPDLVAFTEVDGETRLELHLPQAQIAVEVLYADHYLRAIGFRADVVLSVAMDALPDASISLRVAEVRIEQTTVEDDAIFASARMDLIVPFMVDTMLGLIGDIPIAFELPTAGLASGTLGLPLDIVVRKIAAAGAQEDWLVAYVGLLPAAQPMQLTSLEIQELTPGVVRFAAPGAGVDHQFQLRVGSGQWSRWFSGPGPHVLEHPRLWLIGEHVVAARSRRAANTPAGAATEVAQVEVTEQMAAEPSKAPAPVHHPVADDVAEDVANDGGCSGTEGGGSGPWTLGWALLIGLALRRRERRRRLLVLAGMMFTLGASGCAAEAPPEVPCTYHDSCPGGWMCGLDGTCTPEVACGSDGECCPGATCFNGWCRPSALCDLDADAPRLEGQGETARGCLVAGTSCERPWGGAAEDALTGPGTGGGWCVPQACGPEGACPAGLACLSGRCVEATSPPCGGCASGEACHLLSGRCLEAPGCAACGATEVRVVAESAAVTALSCGADVVTCECAPPLQPPAGRPGREPQVVVVDDVASVLSYDPAYGDLVLTRAPLDDLGAQEHVAVDGVPVSAGGGEDAQGYRGGSFEPGPDRGARPALLAASGTLHVVHQDRDLRKTRYTRLNAAGGVEASLELPIAGVSGRYSCMTTAPDTGWPVALVFVTDNGGSSKLVKVAATEASPKGPADWVTSTVLERPLPLRAAEPCEGACGPLELCVVATDGNPSCASVFDSLSCSEGACGPHEVCTAPGEEPAACHPRVYRQGADDDLPFGAGLFVSCDSRGSQAVAAFYDRDVGALFALDWPWEGTTPTLVAGTAEVWDAPDVGTHSDVAMAPSGAAAGIAFWDATAGALGFAERLGPAEGWSVTTVHQGSSVGANKELGAWASLAYVDGQRPAVAYGDSEQARVLVAARGATGCWQSLEVLAQTAYVTPDLATRDGALVIAARELGFTSQLNPTHRLVLTTIAPPQCAGN